MDNCTAAMMLSSEDEGYTDRMHSVAVGRICYSEAE